MGGHTHYKIIIWFREEEDDADSREFVKDFEAQIEADPLPARTPSSRVVRPPSVH